MTTCSNTAVAAVEVRWWLRHNRPVDVALAPCRGLRSLPAAGHCPHLAAGPAPGPLLPQRQRRYGAEHLDPRVGGAPAATRSAAPLRRQHLLSREGCPGVLGTADRARPHRGAAGMGRRVAGA